MPRRCARSSTGLRTTGCRTTRSRPPAKETPMLRLPPFDYSRPRSVAEAVQLLAASDGSAMAIAGGSDLLPKMKRRQLEPARLVGLRGLPELAGITTGADGSLRIGAGETLATICADPQVARLAPALAAA